jgi:hypothetical protein
MNQIPKFPEFVEINLSHKNFLNKLFDIYQPQISELNFNELFMWRNSYKIFLSNLYNNLCIFVNHYNDKYFYPLIGNNEIKLSLQKLYEYTTKNRIQLKFRCVTQDFLTKIKVFNNVLIEEDFCFYDYVYKTIDLINLKGEKFHSKRNLIKQFSSKYKFEFLSITEDNIKDCIYFIEKWAQKINSVKKYTSQEFEDEIVATTELLKNYFNLDLVGSVITVENNIIAITVASKLNNNTAVVHIEKAFKEFKGCYQTINQLFCKNMLYNYEYINREQDLCDEGLKKAKMSYYPYKIVEKKVVTIKKI